MWTPDKEFYVYVYLDPRKQGSYIFGSYSFDYEPFYVGKGTKNRVYDLYHHKHGLCKNKIKHLKTLNLIPIIKIIKTVKSELIAHLLEQKLINLIGRLDNKTGVLCNHTDGGEGSIGFKHSKETKEKLSYISKNCSLKTRQQMSESHKKENLSFDTRKKLSLGHKGKKHSEETKLKMSLASKGKPKTEEHKLKLRNRKFSEKHKQNISLAKRNPSQETRIKLSESKKGNKNCLGRKISDETKLKMSISLKGKIPWNKGKTRKEESCRH